MPLHLLPKKSWNPYAPAAIARVREDEAAATARDQADAQRRTEHEAAKRLALLRGVTPPRSPSPLELALDDGGKRKRDEGGEDAWQREKRRRRRLQGEDDTDRDIRLARQDKEERDGGGQRGNKDRDAKKRGMNMPITDRKGHIQLFAPEKGRRDGKNEEAEAESKRKERELEDQYTMRFSNAAGFKKGFKDAPWHTKDSSAGDPARYSGTEIVTERVAEEVMDEKYEGRKKRDAVRMSAADPMSIMKTAQVKIKQVEMEREDFKREREKELEILKREQEARDRRYGGRRDSKSRHDNLGGFSLDQESNRERHHRHKHRLIAHQSDHGDREHRHSRRHRDRSRENIHEKRR